MEQFISQRLSLPTSLPPRILEELSLCLGYLTRISSGTPEAYRMGIMAAH